MFVGARFFPGLLRLLLRLVRLAMKVGSLLRKCCSPWGSHRTRRWVLSGFLLVAARLPMMSVVLLSF